MDKKAYIDQEVMQLLQQGGGLGSLYGALVIILLSALDYFVIPEYFSKFLIYRIVASSLLFVIFILNKRRSDKTYQTAIFILGTLVVSVMVELMVLSYGGHQSPYYVGMIIVFMFSLGFLPLFSIALTLALAAITYFIYLVPILLIDTITNYPLFVNHNVFLLATASIGIVWRHYNDKLLIDKLSLEYDLSQEKEQLKKYSTQLEELVAQRTKELAISEQKYRGLFDNAGDGVAVYDGGGIIVNVNRKFCELHGFPVESLIGTNVKLLDAGKDDVEKERRLNRILDGEPLIYEATHYRKDGETVLFEISAKALDIGGELFIQAFHRDISDKKRLQEQVFQSQKMDSIGMLAGGLAHDFNNIISAIIGHVELLREHSNLDSDSRKKLSIIESSSRRASRMISKLLKFARKDAIDIHPVELNTIIRDTTELIGKTLSHRNVEAHLDLNDMIPPVMGDSSQIEQVVMNLMVNAADAMTAGGIIKVRTTSKEIGREAGLIHPHLAPGSYVILKVIDTGSGIPDSIKAKIFDPFFTTKDEGKGTGLGLAMVYGIVKEHKGVVTVYSQVGRGTTFTVYLPSSPIVATIQMKTAGDAALEKGSVLVIEDQRETLNWVKETIQSVGYKVIAVENAVYALQVFREKADEIALVITDIFMPMIDGRDLIKNFKSIKPSIKIIAMSGYEIESFVRQGFPIDDFLRKPFDGIELIKRVNKIVRPYRSLLS